ncbi:hypothetical protein GGI43DRAFT_426984 [Trichoderma evansii]
MSALYSQGFNFSSFIQKDVDPRTGQYTCAIAVYETPAEHRNCPSLHLSLFYNPINTEDVGLGKGWSFNLSSYQHRPPKKCLFLSTGENYQVTETRSALQVEDQKLKSFQFRKNGNQYEVVHKSGQLHAPTGRQLKLVWARWGEQPRLQKIQDGSDILLDIEYGDALVKITRAPNTIEASALTLVRRAGHLVELKLPLNDSPSWAFLYDRDAYYAGHRLPRGDPHATIPYVTSHTVRPGNNQPAIKTSYSYSNKNFLGFDSGFDWKDGEDNLYRAREDYRYSSTVQVDGGAVTTYTYNRFHLLVSSETSKGKVKTSQATTYHMFTNGSFDQQPAQYQLPQSVQTTYQDTSTTQLPCVETTQYAFDDWGNPTQVIQPTGVKIDREYYSPAGETYHCPGDPHGFQRYMKNVTDSVFYYQLPSAAASAHAKYFVAAQEEKAFRDGQEVSSVQHFYVNQPATQDHGRLEHDTTRVSGEYPTTTSWTYQYSSPGHLTQATEIKTFDGSIINEKASFSLFSGLALMHQNSAGVQSDFEYDLTGQLYEATERLEYATLSDKAGYCTRYFTDGLQRVCQVEEQDDQDQVFRLMQEHSYNSLGQCTTVVDTDWTRTTTSNYDSWGQVCRVAESNSVVTSTEDINGQNKSLTQFNKFGAPTKVSFLNRDGTVYAAAESMHDGVGRLVQQKDALGRVTQYQLDLFDRITQTTWPGTRIIKTSFALQSVAALPISIETNNHVLAEQSFDGLGRVTSTQVGGRTTMQTYHGSAPKPSAVITPKGDTYDFTHEPHLNYALMTSVGANDQSSYQYDVKFLVPLQLNGPYCTNHLEYLSSGLLSKEIIRFKNGTEYSASYTDPNGQRQQIQYDDQGRPQKLIQGDLKITWTDGLNTRLTYDDFSREAKRITYNETGHSGLLRQESFQYHEHYRLIDYQCQGSQSPADERGHQLQRQTFTFGNFDNLAQITTVFQDGSQNVTKYLYDAQDATQVTQITNTHPSYDSQTYLEYDQNGLEYDAMSRLTAVRDADGNLLSQVIPGKAEYHLHYGGDMLIGFTSGETQISKQGDSIETQVWAADGHQSVMAWLNDDVHYLQYTPYGFSQPGDGQDCPSIGFNGQWRDPVTGWYHLGNGYRIYNPVLMMFHSPDSWSPFISGEINPYTYCLGDPINRIDPSGHFSLFGIEFTWRDFAIAAVGLAVGIAFGVVTGGAGFAIEVGLGVMVGAASDVATGIIYDSASGKVPTWGSVGTDFAYGVIGGLVGEGVGRAIGKAGKAALRGLEGLHEAASDFVRNAERLKIAGGKSKAKLKPVPKPTASVPEIDALHVRIQNATESDKSQLGALCDELETLRNNHFKNMKEEDRAFTYREPREDKWKINNAGQEHLRDTYLYFRDLVRRQNMNPIEAARGLNDFDFMNIGGNVWKFRLSQGGRVLFQFFETRREVIVKGVGGHT